MKWGWGKGNSDLVWKCLRMQGMDTMSDEVLLLKEEHMQVEKTLKIIKELAEEILTLETMSRVRNYSVIKQLLDDLRVEGEIKQIPLGPYKTYATTLLMHCRAMAGLEADDGHDESQHLRWVYAELDKLRSVHCFDIR